MASPRPESFFAFLIRRPTFWAAIVASGLLAFALSRLAVRESPVEDFGPLAPYSFTSQDGATFGSEQLAGRVYVANFIFTRCPTVCPRFTALMAQAQRELGEGAKDVHLVSFSVDPEHDTPEVLAAYATQYGADPARWTFLTGDYKQLQDTVVGGFKIAMGKEAPAEDDVMSIFHGEHFVVVDARGHLRGYVHAKDEDAVTRVVALARRLADGG